MLQDTESLGSLGIPTPRNYDKKFDDKKLRPWAPLRGPQGDNNSVNNSNNTLKTAENHLKKSRLSTDWGEFLLILAGCISQAIKLL